MDEDLREKIVTLEAGNAALMTMLRRMEHRMMQMEITLRNLWGDHGTDRRYLDTISRTIGSPVQRFEEHDDERHEVWKVVPHDGVCRYCGQHVSIEHPLSGYDPVANSYWHAPCLPTERPKAIIGGQR